MLWHATVEYSVHGTARTEYVHKKRQYNGIEDGGGGAVVFAHKLKSETERGNGVLTHNGTVGMKFQKYNRSAGTKFRRISVNSAVVLLSSPQKICEFIETF